MSTDGMGGAVVAWASDASARGVRVLASGAVASGWSASGTTLLDAGAVVAVSYSGSPLALAAGSSGGVIVSWNDTRLPGHQWVRARWLLGDGTPDPAVSDSGVVVCPETSNASVLGAMGDGSGNAYVGWHDDSGFSWYFVMLSLVQPPAVTGVPAPRRASPLSLGPPWPNPARETLSLRLTLAGDSPGRLELLDLAGRRLRARSVVGAGDHVVRFERLGEFAPGIYVVRLAQGAQVRVARFAVIR